MSTIREKCQHALEKEQEIRLGEIWVQHQTGYTEKWCPCFECHLSQINLSCIPAMIITGKPN